MTQLTAEGIPVSIDTMRSDVAQRAIDVEVIDNAQLNAVWNELGSNTDSLSAFQQSILRREHVTLHVAW